MNAKTRKRIRRLEHEHKRLVAKHKLGMELAMDQIQRHLNHAVRAADVAQLAGMACRKVEGLVRQVLAGSREIQFIMCKGLIGDAFTRINPHEPLPEPDVLLGMPELRTIRVHTHHIGMSFECALAYQGPEPTEGEVASILLVEFCRNLPAITGLVIGNAIRKEWG